METRTVVTVHRRRPNTVILLSRGVLAGRPPTWEWEDDLDWSTFPVSDRVKLRRTVRAWHVVAQALMDGFRDVGEAAARAFSAFDEFGVFDGVAVENVGGSWAASGDVDDFVVRPMLRSGKRA